MSVRELYRSMVESRQRRDLLRQRVYRALVGTPYRAGLLKQGLVYSLLCIIGLAMALPFLWMVSTALKPDALVFRIPPEWFPRPLVWRNFPDSLTVLGHPVHLYIWNTTQVTVACVVGAVLSSSLAAFSFARLDFPGRDALFVLVLSTLMLPFAVTMIPTFILFQKLGWLDSFKPLIIPVWLGGGAFNIFLLRQFFLTIPLEYDEAARIDGATSWQIYWRIIMPLSKPALATVAVFAFIYHWNDFLWPLIVLSSRERWTLSIFLASFQGYMVQPRWNLLMAASTILMLPCLVIFFFSQRLFVRGITITGLKG